MVVKLSERVDVDWFLRVLPSSPRKARHEIAVSDLGIMVSARIISPGAGTQIDALLDQQFDNPQVGSRRVLQVSEGFS